MFSSSAFADTKIDHGIADGLRTSLGYTHPAAGDPVAVRALRQLHDPALRQVFEDLTHHNDPRMRRQAHLGLAELNAPPGLPLATIAAMDGPSARAERALLISAALDRGLIDARDAKVMLGWPGLEAGVKLLVAVDLAKRGEDPGETTWLHGVLRGPQVVPRAVAALLLHHAGEVAGSEALQTLADRSAVEPMSVAVVIQTTLSAGLTSGGGFALSVASETDDADLRELGVRAALGVGTPGAAAQWESFYRSSQSDSDRARWAMIAMRALPGAPREVFDTMADDPTPLVAAIARAGLHISTGDARAAEALRAIHAFDHPVSSSWLLQFLKHHTDPSLTGKIVRFVLADYTPGPLETRDRRLEEVMHATQHWITTTPATASAELIALLNAPCDPAWREAVLLGLLRAGTKDAAAVVSGLNDKHTATPRMLRALLIARHAKHLPEEVLDDLRLAARGAGGFDTALRAQAAWLFVRHRGLAERLRFGASGDSGDSGSLQTFETAQTHEPR